MPPRPFVNDGLWRCLCSGFPSNATVSVVSRAGALQSLHSTHPTHRRPRQAGQQLRAYNTGAPFPHNDGFSFQSSPQEPPPKFYQTSPHEPPPRPFPSFDQQPFTGASRTARSLPALAQLPTQALYECARTEGAKGNYDEVMSICRVLIKDRREPRNIAMYTAVLHSFVSSTNGTAGKLRKVLDEMGFWEEKDGYANGEKKIELDPRACECVLEVLAVHPDYLLREEILEYMKARWFTLSDRALNFIVAGMLRDRHFEHALETLDDMVKNQARVESWLFDKAMWMLLEFGEVDEAFYVLSLKEASHAARVQGMGSAKLGEALWGALLDAAAHEQLYQPARKVWMSRVQPGYLKPGTGTCLFVLQLAARHGDKRLATDVFRVLTERETSLTTHHYELLISTYLKANELNDALNVILIMVDAHFKVDEGTCNPLYMYLSAEALGEESRPMRAFSLLRSYETAGRKIPTAVVNACIQASISLTRFEEALEIYKALHTVSHAGPNTQTFNTLFRGCYLTQRKELAMFLANEMIELDLKPNRLTYDRLIIVCLKADDLTDAMLYYEEMTTLDTSSTTPRGKSKSNLPRKKTWELLITKCVQKGDERAVPLLEAYKKSVEEPRVDLERAVLGRFTVGGVGNTSVEGREAVREAEVAGAGSG